MPTLVILAQNVAEKLDFGKLVSSLIPLIVLIVAFSLIWLILRRSRNSLQPLQDRSWLHMERIEAKTDEIIALLKEIRDQSKIAE